jgi:hypothetical protein
MSGPCGGSVLEQVQDCRAYQRITDRLMSSPDLSELTVRQLLARRRRLAGGLSDPERTLRGVLLEKGRRCSSAGCRCRRGELHGPYTYLAVYTGGRSRTLYVPEALAPVADRDVRLTHENEALMTEISQINLELLRQRALR